MSAWNSLVLIIDRVFSRTRLQSGQAVYSQGELWRIQANLPAVLRAVPRYSIQAVGQHGLEMYDAWTQEYGVMLDVGGGVWLPGRYITGDGSIGGPIDPSDSWSEC